MKSILRGVVAAMACALAFGANAATSINTTGSDNGDWTPFGSPDTSTYGQTFTTGAVDTFLNSFSMYLRDNQSSSGNTLNFRGYISTWDGSKATGIVYTSGVQSLTANASNLISEFAFAPGVQLLANTQYVAFLSSAGFGSQNDATFGMPQGDSLPGESFVYYNTGTDFAALLLNPWDCNSSNCGSLSDVWLKADLSSSAVPIPAALPLFGSVLVGGAWLARRRRKQAAA